MFYRKKFAFLKSYEGFLFFNSHLERVFLPHDLFLFLTYYEKNTVLRAKRKFLQQSITWTKWQKPVKHSLCTNTWEFVYLPKVFTFAAYKNVHTYKITKCSSSMLLKLRKLVWICNSKSYFWQHIYG